MDSGGPCKTIRPSEKGRLEAGCDADFVLVSMEPYTVTRESMFAKHKKAFTKDIHFPAAFRPLTAKAGACTMMGKKSLKLTELWSFLRKPGGFYRRVF